jgi:hypothetical protein
VTPQNVNDWFMLGSKNPAEMRDMAVDRGRLEPLVSAAIKPPSPAAGYLPAVFGSLPLQPLEEGQSSSLSDQAARAAKLHMALGACPHYARLPACVGVLLLSCPGCNAARP